MLVASYNSVCSNIREKIGSVVVALRGVVLVAAVVPIFIDGTCDHYRGTTNLPNSWRSLLFWRAILGIELRSARYE